MAATQMLRGLGAAAVLLGWVTAGAADRYAIEEHRLVPAASFQPGPELTSGDLTLNPEADPDLAFIDAHAAEGQRWTEATLGQELFPRLSAGTMLAAAHDRVAGGNAFLERVDLDLYWLQLRLPALHSVGTQTFRAQVMNLDLLLPLALDPKMRLGLVLGSDLGLQNGGLYGQRYQLMYGLSAGLLDLQLRAGYGLESAPNPVGSSPEFAPAGLAPRQPELLYGAVVGARWAPWGRLTVEATGAHLTETHAELLSVAPGLRFLAGPRRAAELGLSALLDFTRASGGSTELRGIGGLASVRYDFL